MTSERDSTPDQLEGLIEISDSCQRGELEAALTALEERSTPHEYHLSVVFCAERLVNNDHCHGLMVDHLGRALEYLHKADDSDGFMRGLTAAANLQLAHGVQSEVSGLVDALEQTAQLAERTDYMGMAEFLRARQLHGTGDSGQAARILQKLVSERDDWEITAQPEFLQAVHGLRVLVFAAVGHLEMLSSALAQLEPLAGSSSPFVRYHRGLIAETQGRVEDAVSAYESINVGQPSEWVLKASLALVHLQPGRADEHLNRARDVGGEDHFDTMVAQAQLALHRGRYAEARDWAEQLHTSHPTGSLLAQVQVYSAAGPEDLARERASELLKFASQNGLISLQMEAHFFSARLASTIEERLLHITVASDLAMRTRRPGAIAQSMLERASLQLENGQAEEAHRSADVAVNIIGAGHLTSVAVAADLLKGLALQKLGHTDEGRTILETVVGRAMDHNLVRLGSQALLALGRSEEARELLELRGWME